MKRILSFLCVVMLMVSFLAGCSKDNTVEDSSSNENTNQQQSEEKADKGEKEDEPITLRFSWWGGESRHEGTLALIEEYERLNPNVKIKAEYSGWDGYYQKLTTQLAGGTAPDIMQIDQPWIYEFSKDKDMFVDMNTMDTINTDTFDQKFIEDFCMINDQVVGLPTGINGSIMIQNNDALNKAGIDPNTEWNWDNILELGKKFHEQGGDYYLLTDGFVLVEKYVVQKAGDKFIKDDYTLGFDVADLQEAYEYYNQLVENNVVIPESQLAAYSGKDFETPNWIEGKVGLAVNWASTISAYIVDENIEYDTSLIPIMDNTANTGIVVRPSQLIAVNNDCNQKEEAAKFVEYFFNNKDAALLLGTIRGIPSSYLAKDALLEAEELSPIQSKAIDLSVEKAGIKESVPMTNQQVKQMLKDMVQRVAYKDLTPEEAANKLVEDLNTVLEEIK
ncbi:ABC transporter substrate-binding protein [Vallitalea okinawensis]|uniref:ABC transporter substrate-binding protein n=1 Tax=Vallitalea okinawensis TaxID=2078660 RepID=UPI000CFDC10C|nr:ABC transporter substrate-binding protein [Vallitalea okinawensis]